GFAAAVAQYGFTSQLPAVQVDRAAADLLFRTGSEPLSPAAIPPGIHDYRTFSQILADDRPFTGVVAHIAINDIPGFFEISCLIPELLARLVQASDFGCRIGEDELMVICPSPSGTEAQRRLDGIAAQLRRFQEDLAGASVPMFSWAGIEGRGERL